MIRVVPRGATTHVYAHGHWYRPTVDIAGPQAAEFLDLFDDPAPIVGVTSEKGLDVMAENAKLAGWPDTSLFGRLDVHPESFVTTDDEIDLVVCDDMGAESADLGCPHLTWFAWSTSSTAKTPHPRSAAAFAEVCGQAIKNLYLLDVFSDDAPPDRDKWEEPWRNQGREVAPRIRRCPQGSNSWQLLAERRRADKTRREVLVVLSIGYDIDGFRARITGAGPLATDIQAFFQMTGLYAATSSMGARLRVMAGPV